MGKFHDHGIGSKFHKAHSQKEGTPVTKEELLIHYTSLGFSLDGNSSKCLLVGFIYLDQTSKKTYVVLRIVWV